MRRFGICLCLLAALALPACGAPAEPGLTETEGRLLLSVDGTAILVTGDGEPMVLSVQADGDEPWSGFHSGDEICVVHDGVDEVYPMRTRAYEWERSEEGSLEDVPEETLASLEELGWDFGRDACEPEETMRGISARDRA